MSIKNVSLDACYLLLQSVSFVFHQLRFIVTLFQWKMSNFFTFIFILHLYHCSVVLQSCYWQLALLYCYTVTVYRNVSLRKSALFLCPICFLTEDIHV